MNKLLLVELTCSNCEFTKTIELKLNEDEVYAIPNLFCPVDLYKLNRMLMPVEAEVVSVGDKVVKVYEEPPRNTAIGADSLTATTTGTASTPIGTDVEDESQNEDQTDSQDPVPGYARPVVGPEDGDQNTEEAD